MLKQSFNTVKLIKIFLTHVMLLIVTEHIDKTNKYTIKGTIPKYVKKTKYQTLGLFQF